MAIGCGIHRPWPSANRQRVRVTTWGEGKTHGVNGVIMGVRRSVRNFVEEGETEAVRFPGDSARRPWWPCLVGGVNMKGKKHERFFSWRAAVTVAVFFLLASPAAASPGRGMAVRPDTGEVVAQQAPVIENIFPSSAWPGTPVAIQGTDFGPMQLPSVCTVTFNGVDAGTAVLWTDTYIVVVVPEGATSGPVVVTTLAGSSNPYPFTVYEQPQAVPAYFAEGCTRAGFEEWLTLFNPYDSQYTVTVTYMVAEGANRIRYYNLPAHSRTNVYVNSEIGSDRDVALQVTATDRIYAERSLYFRYGTDWLGGHCSIPAVQASPDWYFAEGCTHAGFEEWLCLANPGSQDASVEVKYLFPDGESETRTYTVPAWKRYTVNVNRDVGPGRDVALAVHSDRPIVAERPMYFDYGGMWDGGHITLGASSLSPDWYFAEGCTHAGFEEWLCLANPGEEDATVRVLYYLDGGEERSSRIALPAGKRRTIFVNRDVGPGRDVALAVHSDRPIVAERPMYFDYGGMWDGGHITLGASSLSPDWYFAEGCTNAGFHEWLLLFNPGEEAAQVHITFAFSGGETREEDLEVAPRRRLTLFVNREVGEGRDVSIHVHADQDLVAERSMYFFYHQAWEGGHNSLGAVP